MELLSHFTRTIFIPVARICIGDKQEIAQAHTDLLRLNASNSRHPAFDS